VDSPAEFSMRARHQCDICVPSYAIG
jgi:hypothetical protein